MSKAVKGRTAAKSRTAKRTAPATSRTGARGRGAVVLTLALTVEEARDLDAMGGREFDCYSVFSSLADVIRHYLLLRLLGTRAGFDSPEYGALEGACLASGCACPVVDSKRDGQLWRQCAAAGGPCWSVGRPVEPRRRAVAKPAPAWTGGRGAVTLTLALTRDEAGEFERMAREWGACWGYPDHSSLADVVRHAALITAAAEREAEGVEQGAAPDPGADPDSESSVLAEACPASGCACPVESVRDGQIWRECAADGMPCWSAGRPSRDT